MARRTLKDTAERVLALMRSRGFDDAQVVVATTRLSECNIAFNEPSLLRSLDSQRLMLTGLVDGRKASTEMTDFDDEAVRHGLSELFRDTTTAPQDAANAVSADQHATIVQGPQDSEAAELSDAVRDLLEFRTRETPKMGVDEGFASHTLARSHTVTSRGSEIACSLGFHALSVFGTAREGKQASSFNYAAGLSHGLQGTPATERFGIGAMMRDTEQQIHTRPIGGRFVGDVVLTPRAVADLLSWLHGQIGDVQLIAGSSLYRDRVGQRIASPLLTLTSRFDAPGVAAVSADAFVTPPVEVLRDGVLRMLTPSLYGSRKTGLPHVPTAAGGWELAAGQTPRAQLVGGVARGAIVGRLSMGMPAPSGDFSGVIKNSFAIADGVVGPALSETMINGNIAQMLQQVIAVSRERLDTGVLLVPWLRIGGLHFS
jgi:PmbA protein